MKIQMMEGEKLEREREEKKRKKKKGKGKEERRKRTWQPNLRKTPRGGRMMAKRMSMQVAVPSAMFDGEVAETRDEDGR